MGTVFRQLEKEMTRKQLRIIDLLKQLDADGDGSISASELEQGYTRAHLRVWLYWYIEHSRAWQAGQQPQERAQAKFEHSSK